MTTQRRISLLWKRTSCWRTAGKSGGKRCAPDASRNSTDRRHSRNVWRAVYSAAAVCGAAAGLLGPANATEAWEQALGSMPLTARVTELNMTNCVGTMLTSLQSNAVVKGVVFMPGATDELYFFRRARAALTNPVPTMLDAVKALTAQTRIGAEFRPPLLLLHTAEDWLEPVIKVQDETLIQKIEAAPFVTHAVYNDRDWDTLQPILRKTLKAEILPARHSSDSWHFYRHSFAGWNLSGWEALKAVALAGKTTCRIEKQGGLSLRRTVIFFEQDRRVAPVRDGTRRSDLEGFPRPNPALFVPIRVSLSRL